MPDEPSPPPPEAWQEVLTRSRPDRSQHLCVSLRFQGNRAAFLLLGLVGPC